MISTIVLCAGTLLLGADASVDVKEAIAPAGQVALPPPAPAAKPSTAPSNAAKPGATKQATTPPVAAPAQPPVRVTNRLSVDLPALTPAKPEPPKFQLLAVEQGIVDGTNAERARFGLAPLAVDVNLMGTARQHGTWMASNQQLVHTNIGVAENIAMGQQNTQEVVRCWMNSSGHRANILNGGHRRIGVAAYRTAAGTIYWCQQFAP